MPILLVSLLMLLMAALSSVTLDAKASAERDRLVALERAQAVVFASAKTYWEETGTAPSSLSSLAAAPGHAHLRAYVPVSSGGALPSAKSLVLVKSVTGLVEADADADPANNPLYSQIAVVTSADRSASEAQVLSGASNSCATTSPPRNFESGAIWCGPKGSPWGVVDGIPRRILAERAAAEIAARLQTKFARYVLTTGVTPALSVPTLRPLREIVYVPPSSTLGVSAQTCNGTFALNSVPLGCDDLYTTAGPVAVRYQASTLVVSVPLNIRERGPTGGNPRARTLVITKNISAS